MQKMHHSILEKTIGLHEQIIKEGTK